MNAVLLFSGNANRIASGQGADRLIASKSVSPLCISHVARACPKSFWLLDPKLETQGQSTQLSYPLRIFFLSSLLSCPRAPSSSLMSRQDTLRIFTLTIFTLFLLFFLLNKNCMWRGNPFINMKRYPHCGLKYS